MLVNKEDSRLSPSSFTGPKPAWPLKQKIRQYDRSVMRQQFQWKSCRKI